MKLFIHIPKNAGMSVKDCLQKKYNYPFLGHYTCQQMKAKALLNNYSYDDIFCISRNPYSRMVSTYLFLKIKMERYKHYYYNLDLCLPFKNYSFRHFIKYFLEQDNENYHYMNTYMFLPQHTWLDTEDKITIFKLEELHKLETYLNNKLPYHNKLEYQKSWKDFYDIDTKKIIKSHYEKDFDYFKYLNFF